MRRDVVKGLRVTGTGDTENLDEPLWAVTWEQICRIDMALAELGPFGEVWLIKRNGQLQAIRKLDTVSAGRIGMG